MSIAMGVMDTSRRGALVLLGASIDNARFGAT